MVGPVIEWNLSWDDDWQSAKNNLEDELAEEHPPNPEKAIEYYRYGFSIGHKHPLLEWSDVESDIYQDYMTGAQESLTEESDESDWEHARVWTHLGWKAGRAEYAYS